MAVGSFMMQMETAQEFDRNIIEVPALFFLTWAKLDGDQTVIREFTAQKASGIFFVQGVDLSDNAFVRLYLVFSDRPILVLQGPSSTPSPPIVGAGMVLLELVDPGYSTDKPKKASSARRLGAHAYVDESPGSIQTPDLDLGFIPRYSVQANTVEFVVEGEGQITFDLVDSSGSARGQQSVVVSGHSSSSALIHIPDTLGDADGNVIVAPCVINKSKSIQSIRCGGDDHNDYSRKRRDQIGCRAEKVESTPSEKQRIFGQLPSFEETH